MQQDRWENWFQPGEKLRWEGMPVKGRIHWLRNLGLSAFGSFFFLGGCLPLGTAFGYIEAEDGPVGFGMAVFLFFFSLPFLAVGAGAFLSGWVSDYFKPRRTRYALTDRAGYIATNYWNRKMEVIPVASGVRIEFQETGRNTGSVYFDFKHHTDSDGDKKITKRGFEDIEGADKVYHLLRKLKANVGPEYSE